MVMLAGYSATRGGVNEAKGNRYCHSSTIADARSAGRRPPEIPHIDADTTRLVANEML